MSVADVEILRAACCVTGLDAQIKDAERAVLQRLADNAGVGAVSLQAMIDRAKRDPNFYQEQFRFVHADPSAAMTSILGAAVSDGALTADERVILQHFAQKLGLKPEKFEQLLATAERYIEKRRDASDPV